MLCGAGLENSVMLRLRDRRFRLNAHRQIALTRIPPVLLCPSFHRLARKGGESLQKYKSLPGGRPPRDVSAAQRAGCAVGGVALQGAKGCEGSSAAPGGQEW